MRRLTLRLGEAQAGRTVHTLLRQELLLSAASVRRAKTLPDGILLDGQPVFTNQTGRAGQLLSVAVGDVAGSEQIPPVPGPLTIRYEDEDLVVVEKEGRGQRLNRRGLHRKFGNPQAGVQVSGQAGPLPGQPAIRAVCLHRRGAFPGAHPWKSGRLYQPS